MLLPRSSALSSSLPPCCFRLHKLQLLLSSYACGCKGFSEVRLQASIGTEICRNFSISSLSLFFWIFTISDIRPSSSTNWEFVPPKPMESLLRRQFHVALGALNLKFVAGLSLIPLGHLFFFNNSCRSFRTSARLRTVFVVSLDSRSFPTVANVSPSVIDITTSSHSQPIPSPSVSLPLPTCSR